MSVTISKKTARRAMILKMAAKMFREYGFASTTMRDLAKNIGIEAASLYNHIKSKNEMLEEIVTGMANDCKAHLEDIEQKNTTALAKIESLIRFHTQMMLYHFEEYSVMVNEWMHLGPSVLPQFIADRRDYVKRMEAIIQKGIDGNGLKPIMPYVVVLNILSSVRGLEFWHKSSKTHTAEEMEENMVKHLMEGIRL
ncbi:MAG TPA: TetR/AcrR family transcriptional regulator [Niabella sp.]|jgi:AcrR family transcriptional regulator|nr:TetR/AcrR family transcriptional regulator [Chitinophagaceae bacterium]HRN46423.1 TetR/AcrR family transcriptional regulator [Niabella sp.]HRO83947.1 TetR/AcrR family transcriptional regulator [Niabella sp.]HUN04759.1 TetR/AcrR family transcriptional regulator [Niabella sp.]